jgi:hypothetical protein
VRVDYYYLWFAVTAGWLNQSASDFFFWLARFFLLKVGLKDGSWRIFWNFIIGVGVGVVTSKFTMATRVKELLLWLLYLFDSGCFLGSQTFLFH